MLRGNSYEFFLFTFCTYLLTQCLISQSNSKQMKYFWSTRQFCNFDFTGSLSVSHLVAIKTTNVNRKTIYLSTIASQRIIFSKRYYPLNLISSYNFYFYHNFYHKICTVHNEISRRPSPFYQCRSRHFLFRIPNIITYNNIIKYYNSRFCLTIFIIHCKCSVNLSRTKF